jgi:flagellar basal-body rod protein FlgC
MNYARTFAISAAGMATERMRVDAAALNLANANTVQTPDGTAFQPVQVIARAVQLGGAAAGFPDRIDEGLALAGDQGLGVPVASLEPSGAAPRSVYEPGHPFADAKGFVNYPGVDTATEMVGLMTAMRAYEANVAAMNTARALALKALEIGGGNS